MSLTQQVAVDSDRPSGNFQSDAKPPMGTASGDVKGDPTTAIDVPKFTDEDAQQLFFGAPLGPNDQISHLPLPLCVPQMNQGLDYPFTRAYNPDLAASGISQDDWLKFTDGLVSDLFFTRQLMTNVELSPHRTSHTLPVLR